MTATAHDTRPPGQPPLRTPFFYGWVLVVVSFITGAIGNGVAFWAVGALAVPITADMGWSRSAYFGAMTVRNILSGVVAPVVGPMQDTREGPMRLMLAASLMLGVGIMGLAFMQELWQFYLLFGVLGALSIIGTNDMLSNAIIPKWFVRRRGVALGNATAGTALGSLLAPVSLTFILASMSWRDAWLILGAFTLVVLGALSLLVRTRPEDVGLLPDGDLEPHHAGLGGAGRPVPRAEVSFTRGQAIRNPAFWLIVVSWSLGSIGLGGFQIHWLPYFHDIGFKPEEAALATTVYGLSSLSGRFLWGPFAGRVPVRSLLGLQSLLTALSVVCFIVLVHDLPTLLFAIVLHGLSVGGFFILRPLNVANYFGRGNLGAVSGAMRPVVTVANAAGPLLVGGIYDLTGAYSWSFWFVTACWVVAGVTAVLAKPPRHNPAPAVVAV